MTMLGTLALLPVSLALQPRVLTLDDALKAAVKSQPQLVQAQAQTEAARARADQARSGLLPQVSGSASYRVSVDDITHGGDLGGLFNAGLSGSWLIWDFEQTSSRWHAAEASADATFDTERTVQVGVVLNVRLAYFNARADKDLVQVARDTMANQQKHLDQIQRFVTVGTRPEIDLAQARTDLANARVQLIRAENAYETAKAGLLQAMGVVGAPAEFDVGGESMGGIEIEDGATDQLLAEALKARPEFVTLQAQVRAQELTIRSVDKGLWPQLRVSTGIGESGPAFDQLSLGWNGTLSLTWPLYDGGNTPAKERESRASLRALEAQVELERQQVRFEVEEARLAVREGKAEVEASAEALANAKDRLRLAEGRYAAGVGNIIELGDAQVALTAAAAQKVQSENSLDSARAQLLRALGR